MTSPTNIIIGILFVLVLAALVLYSRKYAGTKYESEYKSKYESGQKEKYESQYNVPRESTRPYNDVVIQFPTQQQQQVTNTGVNPNFNSGHNSSSSFSSNSGGDDANANANDDKQVRFGVEQVRVFSKDNPEFLVDYEATRVKSKDASLDLKDPRYQERLRSQVPLPSLPLLQPLILQPQALAASSVSSMSW